MLVGILRHFKSHSQFQATVPKAVREHLSLNGGDLLVFLKDDDEILLKKGRVKIEE